MNQEIEAYLCIYVTYYQNDWSDWTLIMEFSYNNKVHLATKYSPFYLDHGYHPFTGNEILQQSELPAADKWVETLQQNQENAEAALKLANEAMKLQFDKHRNEAIEYKKGQLVWLDTKHIKSLRPTKKLDDLYFCPFAIEEHIG